MDILHIYHLVQLHERMTWPSSFTIAMYPDLSRIIASK